jgi:hypothetical protein
VYVCAFGPGLMVMMVTVLVMAMMMVTDMVRKHFVM